MQDQLFFVGQKAFISNDKDELLILIDEHIGIDLPGGKVQEGETDLRNSVKREIREETGLEIELGDVFCTWTSYHPLRPGMKDTRNGGHLYLVGYHAKYKTGTVTISEEHTDYKWISKDSFKDITDKRGHYYTVETYFSTQKDD